MRILTIMLLLSVLVTCQSVRAVQTKNIRQDFNKYVAALVSAPALVTYSDDGAADATVMMIGSDNAGIVREPPPAILGIINLRANAIPLLIAHLDDTRLTSAKFDTNNPKPVPVGYVCLDILSNTIDAPRILVEGCADDGLGACIKKGYYFRPDAYNTKGERYTARPEIYQVKLNWQRAYQKGYLKFQYPNWWRPRI